MNRFIIVLFLALLNVFVAPAYAQNPQRTLNIYGWFSSMPPEVLNAFEKETGIKVNLDLMDSNEILEAKLLAGNSGYDIVVPTAWPYVARQVPALLFHPIDRTRLKNYKNLDPDILKRMEKADPGNQYTVPFTWGLVCFAYNPTLVEKHIPQEDLNSWGLLYKPKNIQKLHKCGVVLIDDSTDLIYSTFVYLGLDFNDPSKNALNQVREVLKSIRPFVKRFDFSLSAEQLANGEVCVAQQWVDHVLSAKDKHKDAKNPIPIKIVLPKEGTLMWIDSFAIPVDAPHKDEAYAFIDFILRPEIAAQITNTLFTPTAVLKAKEFLKPEIRQNPLIYPGPEYMKKVHMSEITSMQVQRQVTRTYSMIVTGK